MEQSASIKDLAAALTKFQASVPNVGKGGQNPFFKSKYATLENTISTVRADLAKNGLSFSQFPTGENELATILMHSSGEFIKATAKMSPKDNTPQGQGSAITYLRRYALSAILGIATEDDDDGNAASTQKREPMQSYKVERKVQASDDEAGGAVIRDEEPEMTELQKKKLIASLVDEIVGAPKVKGKVAVTKHYGDKVFDLTSLSLELGNYDEIISALKEKSPSEQLGEAVK